MNLKQIKVLAESGNIARLNAALRAETFWQNDASDIACICGMLADRGFCKEALSTIEEARQRKLPLAERVTNTLDHIQADCFIQSRRFKEAIQLYESIISRRGEPVAHINKALAHWELREYQSALYHYQQALMKVPENAIALRGAGEMLNALERHDEAAELLRRAVQSDPKYSKAYTALGVAYYNVGNWLEAYRALKQAVKLDSSDRIAKLGLEKIETHFQLSSSNVKPRE